MCAVDTYFPRFSFSRKKYKIKFNVLLHSTAVHNNLKWKKKEKEVSTKNCNFAFIIYAMLYIKFIKTTAINIQTTVAAAEWTDSELASAWNTEGVSLCRSNFVTQPTGPPFYPKVMIDMSKFSPCRLVWRKFCRFA